MQRTKLSALQGLDHETWVLRSKEEGDSRQICYELIDLILETEPSSARLLSYYTAAVESRLIESSVAVTRLIQLSSSIEHTRLNSLCLPLLPFNPKPVITHPISFLQQLLQLLTEQQKPNEHQQHQHKLNQQHQQPLDHLLTLTRLLIVHLSHHILSYPPTLLLPIHHSQLLPSIIAAINQSPPINSHHIYTHHLPSILRHLSPSTAKQQQLPLPSSLPSQSPIPFLIYLLLTPGSSTHQLLLSRFITYALSLPHNSNFIFQLLLAAIHIGNHSQSFQHENHKLAWKALLGGGRLAELIRLALDSPSLTSQHQLLNINQLELLSQKLIKQQPPSNNQTSEQTQYTLRHHLWFALLSSLCSNQLIIKEDILKIQSFSDSSIQPDHPNLLLGHHSHIHLGLFPLINCLGLDNKQVTIPEIVIKLQDSLSAASTRFDLSTCISITKSIGTKESLTTLFLWIKPSDILIPITNILDHWTDFKYQNNNNSNDQIINHNHQVNNGNEDDGSSSACEFEKFACLLDWIQGVVGWFGLKKNLRYHLGRTTGFTISYLTNPSTAYSIETLPTKQKDTLESWLEALYGSSGISDELLMKTDPRIFFKICTPSLFKQSFDALQVGLIDLQFFRDALSYFEQELLVVGSAVGVVGWLLDQLDRVGSVSPTSYPTALLEILQAILLSNAITPTSIDLVAARSLRVLRRFNSMFSSSPSITTMATNEENNHDLNRSVKLDLEQIEKKLTTVPVSGLITPTDFLSFSLFDSNRDPASIDTIHKEVTWESALKRAIKKAILIPEEEDSRGDDTMGLWSLLPHVLEAIPVDQFVKITIDGTVDAIKSDDESYSFESSKNESLGVRVQREWDLKKYLRSERAVQAAVDILTWPFDSHHEYQIKLPERFKEKLSTVERYNSKFKIIGSVLLEFFANWGQRIQDYHVPSFDLDKALIERDIIIACLNRIEILEKVVRFDFLTSEKHQKGEQQETESHNQVDLDGHNNQSQSHLFNTNRNNKNELPLSDLFRHICFKSLILEKLNSQNNKKKKRKIKDDDDRIIESQTNDVISKLKDKDSTNKNDDVTQKALGEGISEEEQNERRGKENLEQANNKDKEQDINEQDKSGENADCAQDQQPIISDQDSNEQEKHDGNAVEIRKNQSLQSPLIISLNKKIVNESSSTTTNTNIHQFDILDWILLSLKIELVDYDVLTDQIPLDHPLFKSHVLDLNLHLHLLNSLHFKILDLILL